MSTFPSILTSYTNPTPTSPLNAPSHSGIEVAQNSGLTQLEATVGLSGASSTLGTLIGDLRSPASNGGGHVQTANTGGTGQTSYNKGDILIASSTSVLGKVAIGADNTVLLADSTQTSGVRWAAVVANKAAVSTSSVISTNNSILTVLYSGSVVGGTLSTNNALKFTGEVRSFNGNLTNLVIAANYGNNVTASVILYAQGLGSVWGGIIEGVIAANNTATAQTSWIKLDLGVNSINASIQPNRIFGFGSGNSSVTSANAQDLIITAQNTGAGAGSIIAGVFVVEKIQ